MMDIIPHCPYMKTCRFLLIALTIFFTYTYAATSINKSELPWFILEGDHYNITGGSTAMREAYSSELSRILLNGREVALLTEDDTRLLSVGEFTQGSAANQVIWFSTSDYGAHDIENTLGSKVDIRYRSPFSLVPHLSSTAFISYNENERLIDDTDGFGEEFSLSYLDYFADDRLALLFLVNHESTPVASTYSQIDYASAWDEQAGRNLYGPASEKRNKEGGQTDFLRNYIGLEWDDGIGPTLKWDLLYSEREEFKNSRGYNFGGINTWPNSVSPTPTGNQVFTGTYAYEEPSTGWVEISPGVWQPPNAPFLAESQNSRYKASEDLLATGLNASWETRNWDIDTDLAYSRNKDKGEFESISSRYDDGNNNDETVTFNSPGSFEFSQDLTDPDFNLPYQLNANHTTRKVERGSASLDLERWLNKGIIESIEFGLRRTIHKRRTTNHWGTLQADDGTVFSPDTRGKIDTINGIDYQTVNIESAIQNEFNGGITEFSGYPGSLKIREQTKAAFSKINFSQKLGRGFGLKGDIGLRLLAVDLEGTDFLQSEGNYVELSGKHDYERFLPSLNLSLFPLHGKYAVSFRAARRTVKPNLESLRPSLSDKRLRPAADNYFKVDPWDINDFSLRLDWHYADHAYLSAALEYKHLATYVAQGYVEETINDQTDNVLRPLNAKDAYIQSLVVKWKQPFSFFDRWLMGGSSGIYLSGIINDSNAEALHHAELEITEESGLAQSYSLPGLADVSLSTSLWYSRPSGFSATLRHTYLSERTEGSLHNLHTAERKSQIDLNLSYSPNEQLTFLFEVNNLNEDNYSYYRNNDKFRPGGSSDYGRSYKIGINFEF